MGLETVVYISDLVITNPVGATDPKSQGDDHIRNLKIGLKNTFPNIAGPVTLSHTQLNDAAQKSVSNTFTNAMQRITAADAELRLRNSSGGSNAKVGDFISTGGALMIRAINDAEDTVLRFPFTYTFATDTTALAGAAITLNGVNVVDYARLSQANAFTGNQSIAKANPVFILNDTGGTISATTAYVSLQVAGIERGWFGMGEGSDDLGITNNIGAVKITSGDGEGIILNGVAASDFARLSQANTFTGVPQTVSGTNAQWLAVDGTVEARIQANASGSAVFMGANSNHSLQIWTNGTPRIDISNTGNFDFKGGTVTRNNSSASEVGTAGAPGRNVTATGNTAATDAGGTIHLTSGSAQTFTLDGDPPTDSLVIVENQSGNNWTIAASGTLTWALTGSTGSRTLANGGMAAALHLGSGNWKINGGGLS